MKTLYLELSMGVAGDMLMAALYGICNEAQKDVFIKRINSLCKSRNLRIEMNEITKLGITGYKADVWTDGKVEKSIDEIYSIIDEFDVSDKVKLDAKNVYNIVAEAESKVHGVSVTQVHFHELDVLDAVCSIMGVCLLFEILNVQEVVASSINVGGGYVKCAHGVLTVPLPLTAEILKGIPFFDSGIQSELTTPTGVALVKYFVNRFDRKDALLVTEIGYGMGTKDFETLNAVRVYLSVTTDNCYDSDNILSLSCNIDDMSAEDLSFALDIMFHNGALDAFTTPIYMKKNRSAYMMTVLCKLKDKEKFAELILRHTTSFGVRCSIHDRYKMRINFGKVPSEYGDITLKSGEAFGVKKSKLEYDEICRIANENNKSILEIKNELNVDLRGKKI